MDRARTAAPGAMVLVTGVFALTEERKTAPATDAEIAGYAAECATANTEKCEVCFTGPAIAGCVSFLCRRDVAKLLARIEVLKRERDELRARLLKASGGG